MAKKEKKFNYDKERIFVELIRERSRDTSIENILKEVNKVYKELTQ